MSKSQRAEIQGSMVEYISNRKSLKVVCLLQDSKRIPEDEELLIQEVLSQYGIHLLVIVTKVDRLKQSERHKATINIAKKFGLEKDDVIESGVKTHTQRLLSRILQLT